MPDEPSARAPSRRGLGERTAALLQRPLVLTVLALLAAAGALAGSSALEWGTQVFEVPLRGRVPIDVDGNDLSDALTPIALLALAAVAAVAATGGRLRTALGVVVLAVAVAPGYQALAVLADSGRIQDEAAEADGLAARSQPVGDADLAIAGPVLALLGAVLLATGGVLLVVRGHRMPRLGAKYRAPAANRVAVGDGTTPKRDHQLWDSLDAGRDPTVGDDPP